MKAVIDSDILIDYLQGLDKAKRELEKYAHRAISRISWMEVMAGADDAPEESACRSFLSQFVLHDVTENVAEEAVKLRKQYKLRLPDAIIWATARVEGCLLVTRNIKDFPKNNPGVRCPYAV